MEHENPILVDSNSKGPMYNGPAISSPKQFFPYLNWHLYLSIIFSLSAQYFSTSMKSGFKMFEISSEQNLFGVFEFK